ncbi:MAG: hypothetical protein U0930_09945 [Pirellulales bacterium]
MLINYSTKELYRHSTTFLSMQLVLSMSSEMDKDVLGFANGENHIGFHGGSLGV